MAVHVDEPMLSIEEDEELRLTNGAVIDLSDLDMTLGRRPPPPLMREIERRIQVHMDDVQALADLPDDDPDKTATAEQLRAEYGDRRFLDGNGNIVSRARVFEIDWGFRGRPEFDRMRVRSRELR